MMCFLKTTGKTQTPDTPVLVGIARSGGRAERPHPAHSRALSERRPHILGLKPTEAHEQGLLLAATPTRPQHLPRHTRNLSDMRAYSQAAGPVSEPQGTALITEYAALLLIAFRAELQRKPKHW